jgi:hypothetical protein
MKTEREDAEPKRGENGREGNTETALITMATDMNTRQRERERERETERERE